MALCLWNLEEAAADNTAGRFLLAPGPRLAVAPTSSTPARQQRSLPGRPHEPKYSLDRPAEPT
jgi:hypothetical protein